MTNFSFFLKYAIVAHCAMCTVTKLQHFYSSLTKFCSPPKLLSQSELLIGLPCKICLTKVFFLQGVQYCVVLWWCCLEPPSMNVVSTCLMTREDLLLRPLHNRYSTSAHK